MDLITGQYEGVFKKIKVFLTSRTINIIMISINNHQLFIFLIVTRDNPFFLSIYSANSIYQIILLHLIYQLELKIFRTETIGVFTSFATLLFILLRMANFFRSFKEMPPLRLFECRDMSILGALSPGLNLYKLLIHRTQSWSQIFSQLNNNTALNR